MTEETAEQPGWQALWFFVHLAAVYVIVQFVTPWLAGWTYRILLPVLSSPSGRFQFFFSHLLAFSFIPAFASGLANARFRQRIAELVWLVPTLVLAYKFVTFRAPSVLQSKFSAAFHQYFGGGSVIPDAHNFHDLFAFSGNYDMMRGTAQHQFTAPFYAGIAYSLAAWLTRRTELRQWAVERVKAWEQSRLQDDARRLTVASGDVASLPIRSLLQVPSCAPAKPSPFHGALFR